MATKKQKNADLGLFEIMDRTSVLINTFEDCIIDHVALENRERLQALAHKASEALQLLYQAAANEFFKKNK